MFDNGRLADDALADLGANGLPGLVQGVAQSSTRVSALMRQIDSSDWLTDPDVVKVETTEQGPGRKAEFVVNLKQIRQEDSDGMEDAG